ncbi:MAG: putative baseplate assembly protein [Actinobacteria bacterium]|nr:putative baseplate assembly protein [Actinomycetota bacterium]
MTATVPGSSPLDPQEVVDATANPPGQPSLQRRTAPHPLALARMRDRLAGPGHDLALRSLARTTTDDPAIALLDAWAVVADTVSFYNERIADEGFLRTATQRGSVRELARTLGYELRPGVAAQVDLAFTTETAAGSADVVVVPAGTPVQSVPGPGELPQTFETAADLEVRPVWNRIPAVDSRPQTIEAGDAYVWVRGAVPVRPGDTVLVTFQGLSLGGLLDRPPLVRHELRTALDVVPDADGLTGWTRLDLDEPLVPADDPLALLPRTAVQVHAFRQRLRLFGWSAPDPNLLVVDGQNPPGSDEADPLRVVDPDAPVGATYVWTNYGVEDPLDVDGDHPAILAGSWVALAQPGLALPFLVGGVEPDGASDFAVSGPVTRVDLAADPDLGAFSRRQVVVHAVSTPLLAADEPDTTALDGTVLVLQASDPLLPPGRRVLLTGIDDASAAPSTVAVEVVDCVRSPDGLTMAATVAGPLPALRRQGLVVLGNIATATHGESVAQVLGSGDGRTSFPTYRPRRAPLTYVRATTPDGASAELVVRVDGAQWQQVESLLDAGPDDRVYVVRQDEDGAVRVVLGDGVHGARPATGTENVTATYRVGIGEAGAVAARSVSLLLRRPLGIREVTNPVAAADWAPAEALEEARANAPLRVRTLGRAVSVADHEDFACSYAGVGPARADLLWDGRANRVLVTVLGSQATDPGQDLVDDLHAALDLARDPGAPLSVTAGQWTWFGLRVEVAHDPAFERLAVLDAVVTALQTAFGAPARSFAAPVTSAAALMVVRSVPGVTACTVPRLFGLAALPPPPAPPPLPADDQGRDVLTALPGRYANGVLAAAQLLALADGAVQVGVMSP